MVAPKAGAAKKKITEKPEGPKGLKLGKYRLNPLIAVIITLVIVIIVISSVFLILQLSGSVAKLKSRNVCETPECITLAHQLHNFGDPTADPCFDFFKFACGKYVERTSSDGGPMREKQNIIMRLVKELLRKNEPTISKSEQSMKLLYQKCEFLKDSGNFKQELVQVVGELYKSIQIIGPWPVTEQNWDDSKFNLNEYLVNLARLKLPTNGLFVLSVYKKLSIQAHPFGVFKSVDDLEKITVGILEGNGFRNNDPNFVRQLIDNAVAFKEKLEKLGENTGKFLTYSELKNRVPSIDFDKIIATVIDSERHDWKQVEKKIDVEYSDLLFGESINLATLLKTTSTQTIASYLIFNYLSIFADVLDYSKAANEDCVAAVVKALPQASLRYFVRNHFNKENIKQVSEMVEELKDSYKKIFRDSTWLSEGAKEKAILKVEKMTKMIGYPADSGWEAQVEKEFENMDLEPKDSGFMIGLKVQKSNMESSFDHLLSGSMFFPSITNLAVNAFYAPSLNHLTILVPLMDDMHFDASYPKYAQLAIVGQILGHEIGHGFDNRGSTFDEKGHQNALWGKGDMEKYTKRAQCLVDQYDNYDDPDHGKNLKGAKTLGEMLADQNGMAADWLAFQTTKSSEDSDIIGFEGYDVNKLFFQISASTWCEPPSETPLTAILNNVHPQNRFRVNGVYKNMKAFAETFQCPVGSPMNPRKKCEIF